MSYFIMKVSIHLICFGLSFYALSAVKFDKFTDVKKPVKVQLLLLLSALALGYLVAQFLLTLSIEHGLY